MSDHHKIETKLKALIEVVLAESEQNAAFAQKLAEALDEAKASSTSPEPSSEAEAFQPEDDEQPKQDKQPEPSPLPFDPLQVHLEVAIMNGLENEVRGYMQRLSRPQLKEIVTAQRLPGANALLNEIDTHEDYNDAVEAVIDRVVDKVRGRISAAS